MFVAVCLVFNVQLKLLCCHDDAIVPGRRMTGLLFWWQLQVPICTAQQRVDSIDRSMAEQGRKPGGDAPNFPGSSQFQAQVGPHCGGGSALGPHLKEEP
jgi:hypothetical protein